MNEKTEALNPKILKTADGKSRLHMDAADIRSAGGCRQIWRKRLWQTQQRIFYQEDCNLSLLEGRRRSDRPRQSANAHALNAKEVGLSCYHRPVRRLEITGKAVARGLKYIRRQRLPKADIILMLINDELQADMYKRILSRIWSPGTCDVCPCFNIHFGCIKPRRMWM